MALRCALVGKAPRVLAEAVVEMSFEPGIKRPRLIVSRSKSRATTRAGWGLRPGVGVASPWSVDPFRAAPVLWRRYIHESGPGRG